MNMLTVVSVSLMVSAVCALVLNRRMVAMVRESWRRELVMARVFDEIGRALHESEREHIVYELRHAFLKGREEIAGELLRQARPRPFWKLPPAPGEPWPDE
jgi:hypothetical protein